MLSNGMKNQYIKTSDTETNERKNFRDVAAKDDKPLLLSETLKDDTSERKVLRRSIVIILENKYEYDQIKELLDSVMYQKKLMNCYGLDVMHNKWDLTKFPVTKTDSQLEGIQCDIQKYNETVHKYQEYSKHLGLEYGIDIISEMKKGCNVIFRPPSID
jgi:hypothetical protein